MYLAPDIVATVWTQKTTEKWICCMITRMMSSYPAQVWKVGQIYNNISFIFSAQESRHLRCNISWKGRLIITYSCSQKAENRYQRKEREEAESGWRWDSKDAVSHFLTFPHCKLLIGPHKFFLAFNFFLNSKRLIHCMS